MLSEDGNLSFKKSEDGVSSFKRLDGTRNDKKST
jgi:hypothetical protein